MLNEKVYPVTAEFEKEINNLNEPEVVRFGRLLVEIMSEYEHGSADVDLLFKELRTIFYPGIYMKVYAAILLDTIIAVDVMMSVKK